MNVRELACQSLFTVCQDKGYSNIIVSQTLQKYKLVDRDRRFYTELVYGTLRHLNYLDWIITAVSTRKIIKLDPICLVILRMGLYQIFCLTKVPESAACNESVKLATRFGNKGMAKFVNGILRNGIRRRMEFNIPTLEENTILHLSLTYHQQQWLIKKWIADYGTEETVALCRYFETIPRLCIRANTTKISRDELLHNLQQRDMDAEIAPYAPEGIYLNTIPSIHDIPELQQGLAFIQDESSMLVAHVLDPKSNEVIFDVCAAPGGKTTHIASLAGDTSIVYGCDIYDHKLQLIEKNAQHLGLSNVRVLLQDAATIGEIYADRADRVLVDAPCSGLGVLKRKLDLRWRKKPMDLKRLPELQLTMLESASKCVKPGGILVYSTCTMNDDENVHVVEAFLKRHPEFKPEKASDYCSIYKEGSYIQLLPQIDNLDGFFIARLRRGE